MHCRIRIVTIGMVSDKALRGGTGFDAQRRRAKAVAVRIYEEVLDRLVTMGDVRGKGRVGDGDQLILALPVDVADVHLVLPGADGPRTRAPEDKRPGKEDAPPDGCRLP
jgi:hypothetical protein